MDPKNIKRILAPVDFSEPSADAVETAIAMGRAFGATVELVHVTADAAYPLPPPVDVAMAPVDMARVMEEVARSLTAEEERVRAAGVACESTTLIGRADSEIVRHADETGADIIVMGTHGRSGLSHVLLGSVAQRVVQHAHCPVLIVPWRQRR
jgi:universal stress protein A